MPDTKIWPFVQYSEARLPFCHWATIHYASPNPRAQKGQKEGWRRRKVSKRKCGGETSRSKTASGLFLSRHRSLLHLPRVRPPRKTSPSGLCYRPASHQQHESNPPTLREGLVTACRQFCRCGFADNTIQATPPPHIEGRPK